MYNPEEWHNIRKRVDQIKDKLHKKFPGYYLLIHVETRKLAFGSIAADIKNGGHIDAHLNHQMMHGKKMFVFNSDADVRTHFEPVYGEYFGIRL